jgi:type III pantothenate kinase
MRSGNPSSLPLTNEALLLGLDVGNTHTVMALWAEEAEPLFSFRFNTFKNTTTDELHELIFSFLRTRSIEVEQIQNIVISSVVPEILEKTKRLAQSLQTGFLKIDHHAPIHFQIGIPEPAQLGADRIINSEAAVRCYDGPLVIVDAGTATTFCAIDGDRIYQGGAIAPGFHISNQALFEKASKLTPVEWSVPDSPIGKTTEAAIQSGLTYGAAGFIDHMVERIKSEPRMRGATTVATGGNLGGLFQISESIDHYDPGLTLRGLWLIHQNFLSLN